MQPIQAISLVGFAFCLSVAQILLKVGVYAARKDSSAGIVALFFSLVAKWQFWAAVGFTGSLVLVWAWILSVIPLSTAYPFVVLALVFAGLLEHFLFGEALTLNFFIGCTLIFAGLLFILRR